MSSTVKNPSAIAVSSERSSSGIPNRPKRPSPSSGPAGPEQAPILLADDNPGGDSTKQVKRTKKGCISCRLRKKRCDETKPTCETCARLGIECLGYGSRRPKWLKGDDNSLKARKELKKQIMANRGWTEDREPTAVAKRRRSSHRNDPETDLGVELSPGSPATESAALRTGLLSSNLTEHPHTVPQDLQAQDESSLEKDRAPSSTRGTTHQGMGQLVNLVPSVDPSMEEMWRILFGPQSQPAQAATNYQPQFTPHISPLAVPHAPIYLPFPLGTSPEADGVGRSVHLPEAHEPTAQQIQADPPFYSAPDCTIPGTDTLLPDFSFLYHYLNIVLPLQYRFAFRAIAELITPLAVAHPDVLNAVSSLAAMHLVTQRTKAPMSIGLSSAETASWELPRRQNSQADRDAQTARTFHAGSLQRLRYLSNKDLTSEDVIVSALFAISFYLFSGGTSRGWVDVLETARRCLASALAASPEIMTGVINPNSNSPWKRYKSLVLVMIWMDVFGSVTQNRAPKGLDTYRRLLTHFPSRSSDNRVRLHMEDVMGCDDTTFLAIAEIVQLSEWREHMERAGCLSIKELIERASVVEKLLDERAFREFTLDQSASIDAVDNCDTTAALDSLNKGMDDRRVVRAMSDIFYSAARVLLASVVHGPWPKVPELASAVEETISSLSLLDLHVPSPGPDINRALIFPITLAGCHAASPAQHEFFRSRFTHLRPEATAFGNTQQALQLMEEVWAQRIRGGPGVRVDWRQTMRNLGWEAGILLV